MARKMVAAGRLQRLVQERQDWPGGFFAPMDKLCKAMETC
jgi:hypothetical protein